MKNLKLFSVTLMVSAFVMTSCSKSAGPAGPAGPIGPAGPDSVSYSAWTQFNMTQMTQTVGTTIDTFYVQNITATSVTQSVLDKSVILSYISFKDQAGATNVFSASEITNMEVTFAVGTIQLLSVSDYSFSITGWSYRYVIVPGTIAVNGMASGPAKGYTKDQLQSMNYQQIVKLLGLPASAGSN